MAPGVTPCRACRSPCRCRRPRGSRDPEIHLHPLDLVGLSIEHRSRRPTPAQCAPRRRGRWVAHLGRSPESQALLLLLNANPSICLASYYLSDQRHPSLCLPHSRQPYPRPPIGVAIDRQLRQRHWHAWRSAFDRRRSDCRGLSRWLKLSLPGPYAKTSVPSASIKPRQREVSTWRPILLEPLADSAIGEAFLDLRALRRLQERRRSRLSPAPRFCPFPHSTLLRRSPGLAREKLRHRSPHQQNVKKTRLFLPSLYSPLLITPLTYILYIYIIIKHHI